MSGLTDKLSGKAKQISGDATDDKKLKREGKMEEMKGEAKQKLGGILDKVTDTLDDAKKKIK